MWEEEDNLDPEEFDPKVFFGLHGETWSSAGWLSVGTVIIWMVVVNCVLSASAWSCLFCSMSYRLRVYRLACET